MTEEERSKADSAWFLLTVFIISLTLVLSGQAVFWIPLFVSLVFLPGGYFVDLIFERFGWTDERLEEIGQRNTDRVHRWFEKRRN